MALGDGSATAVDEQPQGRGDSDKQPREWRQAALGVGARRQPRRAIAAAAAGPATGNHGTAGGGRAATGSSGGGCNTPGVCTVSK